MEAKYIIMICGASAIVICIGIYAIYYHFKIKKDPTFGQSKLDMYLMGLAKKMQKNQNLYFILENQIDWYLVKNMRKQVSAIMVSPQKVFLFKTFTIIKPDDQVGVEAENKFLEKLSEKLNLEPSNFKFIKCWQGDLYFDDQKISMKSYGDLIMMINQYLATENNEMINLKKLRKLSSKKG